MYRPVRTEPRTSTRFARAHRMLAAWVIACAVVAGARGQELVSPDSPDAVVERYLQLHGLEQLQATMLRERLATANGDERLAIAERLGEIYAEMLGDDIDPGKRQELERLSRELFENVPGVDSFGLRIKLAKAQYLPAERAAEHWRLGQLDPEKARETVRVLESVRQSFRDLGRSLNGQVEAYDRMRRRGSEAEQQNAATKLAEAQSLRSAAFYYAGWSGYYLALMSGREDVAQAAVRDLGWLLGAEGGPVSIERLGSALLSYEHVARAALAVALCRSLEGDHGGAITWLRGMRESTQLNETVRAELLPREIDVYARAGRWEELANVLSASTERPLPVLEARLVAVLAMSLPQQSGAEQERARALASMAIADLVARGEVANVLDLMRQFGTLPLGGEGFIVRYVRGLLAYDEARQAHAQSGEDSAQPTGQASVATKYGEAADLLRAAFEASDADKFPAERVRAGLSLGLSELYRGRLLEAANRFEQTASLAQEPTQREEALWLAIASLDRLKTQGSEEARQRGEALAVVYMNEFPQTERAALLLLRRADADDLDTERAVEVLFAVKPESPVYESARRHLGRLLYRAYRRAPAERRDAEGARFLDVAEQLLDMDEKLVRSTDRKQATDAAQAVVVRVRQILDVVLSSAAPQLSRAEGALDRLERVANEVGLNLGELADELAYRRLQIALARGQKDRVEELLTQLTRSGGRFARSADRLLYREALLAWSKPGAGASEAERLVRFGGRILGTPDDPGDRLSEQTLMGVAERVSEAAEFLWKQNQDEAMRSLALRLTRQWFEKGLWTESMLRRLAETGESAGEKRMAFEAWNTLSAAYEEGEPTWFEARYNALRLLIEIDPQRGREVMAQHEALYPSFGPEPWGAKLRALSARVKLLPQIQAPGGGTP